MASSNNDPSNKGWGFSVLDIEAAAISVEYQNNIVGFDADLLHADAKIGINPSKVIGIDAGAEVAGASGNVHIPIPFTNHDIVVTGEVSAIGLGLEAGYIPEKGWGFKVTVVGGLGAFVNIQPRPNK